MAERESPAYRWSDAWLLQAIIVGGDSEGATLYEIVRAGDGLNHAQFTPAELESGFARLSVGGLIEERDGRFLPTARADALYRQASKRGSAYTVRKAMERLMRAAPWQPGEPHPHPENTLSYPGFSTEAHREATARWHKDARRMVARSRGKDRGKPGQR